MKIGFIPEYSKWFGDICLEVIPPEIELFRHFDSFEEEATNIIFSKKRSIPEWKYVLSNYIDTHYHEWIRISFSLSTMYMYLNIFNQSSKCCSRFSHTRVSPWKINLSRVDGGWWSGGWQNNHYINKSDMLQLQTLRFWERAVVL